MCKLDILIDKVWSKTKCHPTKGVMTLSGKKTVRLDLYREGVEYSLVLSTLSVIVNGKEICAYADCIIYNDNKYPVSFRSLNKVIDLAIGA